MDEIQLISLLSIIVLLIIVGTVSGNNRLKCQTPKENFSPLGFASNCPEFELPKTNLRIEECGPGCWMLKEGKEKTKETFKVNGKRNCTTDRIPEIPQQLPIGHLSTIGSPLLGQAMCSSGVNGVQKLSKFNPFGELVKKHGEVNQFTQSYASCEFGANNIFDKDMLQY